MRKQMQEIEISDSQQCKVNNLAYCAVCSHYPTDILSVRGRVNAFQEMMIIS